MSVQVYDKNGQPYEADLIDGIKYRELEKLLAAAKEDTERLDWLDGNRPWVHNCCNGFDGGPYWGLAPAGRETIYGDTFRAAIDQARKAQP